MASRRIKKSITEKEYKLLMNHTKVDETLEDFSRKRFLMIFCLLYYSGARINELSQIKKININEAIKNAETVIVTHKTKYEKKFIF